MSPPDPFENLIQELAPTFCQSPDNLHLRPNISAKKLHGAIKSYAPEVAPGNVIALYDSTTFGRASEGFLITAAAFYAKELLRDARRFDFQALSAMELVQKETPRKKKPPKVETALTVHLADGTRCDLRETDLKLVPFHSFLEKVRELQQQGLIADTDKLIILQDMPDRVKVNYVRAVVQLAMENGGTIDARELAEIQVLMTQLDFSAESRHDIRQYVQEADRSLTDILMEMDRHVPKGSEHALHISLLKDMIRIHRATRPEGSFQDNPLIVAVADTYHIRAEQVAVIEQACINDELILKGRVDDNLIVKNAKELASKAGAVGVPVAAVYLSGSVVGLSAPGITSGLAALGLGGVLGFSSMVTGIGMAVLIGVGAYKGLKWVTGGGKRSKLEKREFIIQEVIRLNQQTITHLAEDINFFGHKIVALTRETQMDRQLIEKLGRELTVFGHALQVLKDRGINLEDVQHDA